MKRKLSKKDLKRIRLINVHSPQACEGRGCVIHHWSKHHMRQMPLHWRSDRNIFERICSHGVGHPDPDSAAFLKSVGQSYENVHGCCGCCHLPSTEVADETIADAEINSPDEKDTAQTS